MKPAKMYTKEQLQMADFTLRLLQENGNALDRGAINGTLTDKYGYGMEPHLMLESLISDHHFIEPWGQDWLRLTPAGIKAAGTGFEKSLRQEKTKWKLALTKSAWEILLGVIASAIAAALAWLFS